MVRSGNNWTSNSCENTKPDNVLEKMKRCHRSHLNEVSFFKVTPSNDFLDCVDHVRRFARINFCRTSAHIRRTSEGRLILDRELLHQMRYVTLNGKFYKRRI